MLMRDPNGRSVPAQFPEAAYPLKRPDCRGWSRSWRCRDREPRPAAIALRALADSAVAWIALAPLALDGCARGRFPAIAAFPRRPESGLASLPDPLPVRDAEYAWQSPTRVSPDRLLP